jgi:hypothetical protein
MVSQASWAAWLVLAIVLLASLSLPKPIVPDAPLAAAMLLSCFLLSKLIGTMNNWRGGWTVGPRYLSTLEPIIGLVTLVGLDSIARLGPAWKRAATVFAAGATLHAFLMSAVPSAWFPHVPTEFTSPFFELFVPVLRDGYVPRNAGTFLFDWHGLKAMAPFFVVAVVIALIILRGDEKRSVPIAAHALGGIAVMFFLLTPFAAAAKYENMGVTRFVKSVWEPQPQPTPPPHASAPGAPPPSESAQQLRERARRLAATGDENGAFDLYRRAASAQH